MAAFVIILSALVLFPTENMKEFSRHSNGVAEYVLVQEKSCDTGLRDSGYALVPFRSMVFKQKNADGTVSEPVCNE